jgi:hypothetical protein
VATAVISGLAGCSPRSGDAAPAYSPTFFSADEWAFVRAAVGRLIPSEGPGPGGIEAGVPEFIDRQMEMPYGHGAYFYLIGPFQTDVPPSLGYQLRYNPREIYRLGIAAANGEARKAQGKTFAELPADAQEARGIRSRVVSMPSWDIFEHQPQAYRDSVLPPEVTARVAIEQASAFGWERYVGWTGRVMGMKAFGASAPLKELQKKFGFEPDRVIETVKELLGKA